MKIGILALGRPTFDIDYANEKLAIMLQKLEQTGHSLVGNKNLLFDENEAQQAIENLHQEQVDQVLLLQVTFTDASMTVGVSKSFSQPVSIWAIPEPRAGGRLRLNSFCGLNLASHALGLNSSQFSWIYSNPETTSVDELHALFNGERAAGRLLAKDIPSANDAGLKVAESLKGKRIGRIGNHPVGFDTSAYEKDSVLSLTGITVEAMPMDTLFEKARSTAPERVSDLRTQLDKQVDNTSELDQAQLDRSLRLKCGLDDLHQEKQLDAFAIRCWPETFTEYGGAVCGPAAMLGENKIPCACEADVYGSLTQMLLQEAADSPVFLTDLVDVDVEDNSAVIWHCGQAPVSMCDPEVKATGTVHTNRKQPLLYEFPLKPGQITFARLSKAHNNIALIIGSAEMLSRPMAYTGTSGVMRFERDSKTTLKDIIDSGLEHHFAITYGDHRSALVGAAGALNIPVLEI